MSHRCPPLTLGLVGTWPIGPPDTVLGPVGMEARTGVARGGPSVVGHHQWKVGSSGVKEGWGAELGDREGLRTRSPLAAGLKSGR